MSEVICEVEHGSSGYWATVDLRDVILRKPLGLQFSDEELAAEESSRHLACYRDDRLVGCLVLSPLGGSDVRMRQVAVVPELQGHPCQRHHRRKQGRKHYNSVQPQQKYQNSFVAIHRRGHSHPSCNLFRNAARVSHPFNRRQPCLG
jgi:hypothetical protein